MQAEPVAESVVVQGGTKAVVAEALRDARPGHSREALIQRLREVMRAQPPAVP